MAPSYTTRAENRDRGVHRHLPPKKTSTGASHREEDAISVGSKGSVQYSAASASTTISSLGTALRGPEYIRVVVKVRPPSDLEVKNRYNRAVECSDDGRSISVKLDSTGSPKSERPLRYDQVYTESTSQKDFFEQCGLVDIINKALEGYSTTIFAYGQTGSGKTYTMTGPTESNVPELLGIVPRALRYIFECICGAEANSKAQQGSPNATHRKDDNKIDTNKVVVRAGYLEIYNEQVRDLLNPSAVGLPIRWSRQRGGFYVENAFVVECEVLDDCLAVLEEGLRNRAAAAHQLNTSSSRSHSVLTLYLDSEEAPASNDEDQRPIHRFGKICFVDLAGSERQSKSQSVGTTLVEATSINKSLLVLGHCISMLSESKNRKNGASCHVPFRESCLTKLLMDSIGGNGYALMIACVGPTQYSVTETIQTLRYASRAKLIRNSPTVKRDPNEELIARLRNRIQFLQLENEQLRLLSSQNALGYSMQGSDKLVKMASDGESLAKDSRTGDVRHGSKREEHFNILLRSKEMEIESLQFENKELILTMQRAENAYGILMRENDSLRASLAKMTQIPRHGHAMQGESKTEYTVDTYLRHRDDKLQLGKEAGKHGDEIKSGKQSSTSAKSPSLTSLDVENSFNRASPSTSGPQNLQKPIDDEQRQRKGIASKVIKAIKKTMGTNRDGDSPQPKTEDDVTGSYEFPGQGEEYLENLKRDVETLDREIYLMEDNHPKVKPKSKSKKGTK